jgi:hypothetical protein
MLVVIFIFSEEEYMYLRNPIQSMDTDGPMESQILEPPYNTHMQIE